MTKRLTDFTEGSIPRHLITFSIPLFLGNLLQALYNTVDSIWVGRFMGPNALAAVSVGFPLIMAIVAVTMGLTMAATVLVSQYYGAKQTDMVRRTVGNTLGLLLIVSAVLSTLGVIFTPQLLRWINTPADLMAMAVPYLRIFIAGLVFMFFYNGLSSILRGLGDSRTPLLFLFYATVINIVLDPLMIFGIGPFPKMGVSGAALATVIAQAVSGFMLLWHLRSFESILPPMHEWRVEKGLTWTTIKIGIPAGVQQLLVSLGGLVLMAIINKFGSTVVAAYGAGMRIDQFMFMPSMSTSLAISALVGQNMGAGKHHRVGETVRWGAILTAAITGVVTLIVLLVPRAVLSPFTADADVLAIGARYLRIVGLSYIPFSLMFAVNGVLRGAGDTFPTMLTTLASLWIVRVPLAKILSGIPSLGSTGVWIAMAISPVVGLTISYIYYLTGRWKRMGVVHHGPVLEEG